MDSLQAFPKLMPSATGDAVDFPPGAFEGSFTSLDWATPKLPPSASMKRWHFFCLSTHEVILTGVVMDLGALGNTFISAVDLKSGEKLWDEGHLGVPGLQIQLNKHPAIHAAASFRSQSGEDLRIQTLFTGQEPQHAPPRFQWTAQFSSTLERRSLKLNATLGPSQAPSLAVVGSGDALARACTQKTHLLPVDGRLEIERSTEKRCYDLKGGWGGLDYTAGVLPRHTKWWWGWGWVETPQGQLGLNLHAGNNLGGIGENAAFFNGKVVPLKECKFQRATRSRSGAASVVSIRSPEVDLEFTALGVHEDRRHWKVPGVEWTLVRSRFEQGLGQCSGSVTLPSGGKLAVEKAPMILERQDVVW